MDCSTAQRSAAQDEHRLSAGILQQHGMEDSSGHSCSRSLAETLALSGS